MSNVENLTNTKFKVLSYLYDIKGKDNLVKVTQSEIVSEFGMSRGSVNNIFKNLKDKGYLVHDNSHIGRYYLTEEAIRAVEMFRKSDKK